MTEQTNALDAMLKDAREFAPEEHLVHLVTVTEASGDEWRTVITANQHWKRWDIGTEAAKAARLGKAIFRREFPSGEIHMRFETGQTVFVGIGQA